MDEIEIIVEDLTEEVTLNLITSDGITDHTQLTNIGNKTHSTLDSEVTANTLKVGITPTQASDITSNNAKVTYPGDQDLSGLAEKTNVLELDNTDIFTPTADYHPSTKKYVDDNAGGGGGKFVDGTDPLDAVYLLGKMAVGTPDPISLVEFKGDMPILSISDNRSLASWTAGQEIASLDFVSNDDTLAGGAFARIIGTNRGSSPATVPVGALSFRVGTQGGTPSEKMRIESTGVEIALLKLTGDLTIDKSDNAELTLDAGTNDRQSIINFTRAGVATNQASIVAEFDGLASGIYLALHAGTADQERVRITGEGKSGFGVTDPQAMVDVAGGIKIADDTDVASVDKVGTRRYREDANNSYYEICMKTGVSTYAWEIILQKTW